MVLSFSANNIVETAKEGSAAANQVVGNRKLAIFFTYVGLEMHSALSNLFASAKPKDTLFADIAWILEKRSTPNH